MANKEIILEKDNYFEYFNSVYGTYKESYLKELPGLNNFQRAINEKEFFDITIRCNNALVTSINYFKRNNIKYYDDSIKTYDRILMAACESYIYKLFTNAQDELNNYIIKRNEISQKLVKDMKFKFAEKFGLSLYYKVFKKHLNMKSNYKDIQYHVDNFYMYGNLITSFDPDKDMNEVIENYLPILMHNLKRSLANTNYTQEKQYDYQFKLFHYQVLRLYDGLMKLKKFETAKKLCDLEMSINNEEYNLMIDNIANIENLSKEQVQKLKKLNPMM